MITRFIDGAFIGQSYIDALKEDSRQFLARFMLNGSELSCGIKKVEFGKGSCGDTTQFSIGSIFGSSMTAEVLDLTDDVKNEILELQIGLYVESQSAWRWIKVGEYKIAEVNKNIYGSTLTGYGKIVSNSSGQFTEPATKTLANIGTEIGTELGCTVYFDSGIDTTQVITASMNGLTTYQAIQVLTSVIGGYAVDRSDGNVHIYLFNDTSNLAVDTSLMNTLPEVEEQDYSITGIRCVVSEASADSTGDIAEVGYEQGSPVNLIFNDQYMTQSMFTTMATNLIGYTYRPGKINLSLGNPRLEGNDVLQVTDADGSVYVVPCHQIRHIYDGGFRTEITAVSGSNIDNSIGSVAPLQDFIKNTSQNFVKVENEIENLAEGIQYFWHDNDGAHVSTIPQSSYILHSPGSTCYEVLITSSQIIFRRGFTGIYGTQWQWVNLGIYANDGITLKDFASMTSSGIILGDINDATYQLKLDPTEGVSLNGNIVIVSDYATEAVSESTTTSRIVSGLMNGSSTAFTFTVPLECVIPEGLSVNITDIRANFKIAGTSYFIDGDYHAGGYTWMNSPYSLSAQVAGTVMTITMSKTSTFKKHGTSTAVDAYASITCEIDRLNWTLPAASRNLMRSTGIVETPDVKPPSEER